MHILGKTLFVTCSASYKNSDFVSDPLYWYNLTNKYEVNYQLQPSGTSSLSLCATFLYKRATSAGLILLKYDLHLPLHRRAL